MRGRISEVRWRKDCVVNGNNRDGAEKHGRQVSLHPDLTTTLCTLTSR